LVDWFWNRIRALPNRAGGLAVSGCAPFINSFEAVEPRLLLAVSVSINFQPADSVAAPAGYLIDSGQTYGARNGLTYGWSADRTAYARRRFSLSSPDNRYDTLVMMQTPTGASTAWEIALPSAQYRIHIVAGDPGYPAGTIKVNAEGQSVINATTDATHLWADKYAFVNVTDGKLTLSAGSSSANLKLSFIEITDALTSPITRPPVFPPIQRDVTAGINLDGLADWETLGPFVDLASTFRNWGRPRPQDVDPTIKRTADNYPLEDAGALTFAKTYPDGDYDVTWKGEGDLSFDGMQAIFTPLGTDPDGTHHARLNITHPAEPEGDWLRMYIKNITNPQNPIHDLHIVSSTETHPAEYGPFRAAFIERMAAFDGPIRFMDWMRTNASKVKNWADRPTTATFSYTHDAGVPYEYYIALANLLHRDVWINIPAEATNDYITQLAQLFKAGLDPALKVYIEYSNEVWAGGVQGNYVSGLASGDSELTASDSFGRTAQEAAKQLIRAADIFRTQFGATASQIRPEFGGFIANDYWTSSAMSWIQTKYGNVRAKITGVAVGMYVGSESDMGSLNTPSLTLDQIFPWMNQWIDNTIDPWLKNHARLTDLYELQLDTYEAGQHLTAYAVPATLDVKKQAQADPRMAEVYNHLMQRFMMNGGTLFNNFTLAGTYTQYGFWGLLDEIDKTSSVRYDAVKVLASSTFYFASQAAQVVALEEAPATDPSAALAGYEPIIARPAPVLPEPLAPTPVPVIPPPPVEVIVPPIPKVDPPKPVVVTPPVVKPVPPVIVAPRPIVTPAPPKVITAPKPAPVIIPVKNPATKPLPVPVKPIVKSPPAPVIAPKPKPVVTVAPTPIPTKAKSVAVIPAIGEPARKASALPPKPALSALLLRPAPVVVQPPLKKTEPEAGFLAVVPALAPIASLRPVFSRNRVGR